MEQGEDDGWNPHASRFIKSNPSVQVPVRIFVVRMPLFSGQRIDNYAWDDVLRVGIFQVEEVTR